MAMMVSLCMMMCTLPAKAQLSPYDENKPVGWTNIGMETTGSGGANPVYVETYEELKAALQACKNGKASKTIYIRGNIEVPEKLRYDKIENCSIYGLPGSSLYNRNHNDNADYAGFFFCQGWKNVIFRNLTLLGAGAYDISACDNIQLVECDHIWIDHCDIQDGVDGNLDAKTKSDHITISWCKFSYLIAPWAKEGESADHRCSSMWGSSDNRGDDEGYLNATFVNCWWYHGCGQRCPRIRFGNVHIANCLWENGTTDDPAQYCVGVGHQSDMYIENGDFSNTVVSENHLKYYLTEKKVYDLTVKGCIGEPDRQEKGAGHTGGYYIPYDDPNYKLNVYPAALVKSVLTDPENGAGATLSEEELDTRGNPDLITAVKNVNAAGVAKGMRAYYNADGTQASAPQKGVTIEVGADGKTRKVVR